MSIFADRAKMWWLEITAEIIKSNESILWVIFQPLSMASTYLDCRKLYIVTTKLTRMKLTSSPGRCSAVLAMWGLHANNYLKLVLEKVQRYHQLSKDSIFSYRRNKTVNGGTSWQRAARQRFHKDKGWLLWGNSYLISTQFKSMLAGALEQKKSLWVF